MKRQLFSADLPDGINYMETSVINQNAETGLPIFHSKS